MSYCMYLRKSRADEQADISNRFDTLQRHEDILFELSRKLDLKIEKVFREIVSGDSIEARPVMQELLFQVEKKLWDGVFVIEVERLARGDTVDQGIVARTFKYSKTKIITPIKIYDPCDEFDEEYFEFGLFMSRREYKVINRRLQRGRLSSVNEGKYPGSTPPYGYKKVKLPGEKGFTLKAFEEQSKIVRLIFKLFLTGFENSQGAYEPLGTSKIAQFLNKNSVPSPKNGRWSCSTVHDILANPVYCGRIRWAFRPSIKSIEKGKLKTARPRKKPKEYITVKGIHKGIISEKDFLMAEKKLGLNHVTVSRELKNPLAGLVFCGKCGAKMVRKSCEKYDMLICPNGCGNVGSNLSLIEERLWDFLELWLKKLPKQFKNAVCDYRSDPNNLTSETAEKNTSVEDYAGVPWISQKDIEKISHSQLCRRLLILERQLSSVCEFFEQGIYSKELFLRRKAELESEISLIRTYIKAQKKTAADNNAENTYADQDFSYCHAPAFSSKVIDIDWKGIGLLTPKTKNEIFKELIFKAEYKKEKSGRWHCSADSFQLTVFPKLPAFFENL